VHVNVIYAIALIALLFSKNSGFANCRKLYKNSKALLLIRFIVIAYNYIAELKC
jgi:hypothetical protein